MKWLYERGVRIKRIREHDSSTKNILSKHKLRESNFTKSHMAKRDVWGSLEVQVKPHLQSYEPHLKNWVNFSIEDCGC